jgi:hypothetical protein
VLDFGCGRGGIVELGLAKGLDIFGVDTFEGKYISSFNTLPAHLKDRVYRIDGPLPFPDASFDVVVSNQVFEHIPDPMTVLPEIRRVLKPGGAFLVLFPTVETWYEGHAGIYFAHHLQQHPRLLRAYLSLAHKLGFGILRTGKSARAWAEYMAGIIESMCYYHRRADAERWLTETFGAAPKSMAADYVAFRIGARVHRWLPKSLVRAAYRAVAHARAGVILAVHIPSRR